MSAPTDLTWLWVSVATVLGTAVLVVAGWLLHRAWTRRAERRRARAMLSASLEALGRRRRDLDQRYAEHLLSARDVLDAPLLSDVSVPQTAAFVEAHAAMGNLPVTLDLHLEPSLLLAAITTQDEVVTRAEQAWRVADAHARKVGLGSMTLDERRRVTQARQLLVLAEDDATTAFERATALSQARKLLEGLVVLPERTVAALEAGSRKALASA